MSLEHITTILFDFDDTLGDREAYAYTCAKDILKQHCDVKDPVQFEAILQDFMLWDEHGNIVKKHILDMLEQKYQIKMEYEYFNTLWADSLWKYTVLFDDTLDTLKQLSKKYTLGIITNGPSEGQRNKIKITHVDEIIPMDHVIVSGDYPFSKPDPRIFLEACNKLNVKPEECMFVGDIFSNDVLGSSKAGMTPIWMWPSSKRKQESGVTTIHALSELLSIL